MITETKKTYQEGLSELRSHLKEVLPSAALSVFDEDAAQLQETHQSVLKIFPGEKSPDFPLPNALGEPINLYQLLKENRVVMVFYRGSWCRTVTCNWRYIKTR